jgi:integrase
MTMTTVKGHPGIRKKPNGHYVATKSVGGKRFYKEFLTLREASRWKNEYHPLLSPSYQSKIIPAVSDQSNGKDKSINFGEVVEKYRARFLKSLEPYTQYKKEQRMSKFFTPLLSVPMCAMGPEVIDNHLADLKLQVEKSSRRCNFDKELKDLASVFSWYRETVDITFVSPVTRTHFKLGKIKDVESKRKDMDIEEFAAFAAHLRPMFRSMAVLMLLWAARVGEAAALMDETVSFKRKEVWLTNVIVWIRGRPQLKRGTKTGADAVVKMTEMAQDELRKLEAMRPKGCKYFFQRKGKPLRYGLILSEFNRALKEAGLPYSGTHIIRHTMATITRRSHGLDAAQAILRHTTARMSEEYARLDASEKVSNVVIQAEELFREAATRSHVRATICDQESLSGGF